MNPAEKALWFVESHFARDISLDEVAAVAGVSRYHITRAFAAATGMPVMAYAKARRLSEAAKVLAKGAPDILNVALEAGYGSHEAFTRAFRDQFGITPEQLRRGRIIEIIPLVEPIAMDDKALSLNPNYLEAMTYKNILLRMQANTEKDPKVQKELLNKADELRNKVMDAQKRKATGKG